MRGVGWLLVKMAGENPDASIMKKVRVVSTVDDSLVK